MKKIGLDAGHGLFTAGKQTPNGIKEWSLNDDVCDRIQEKLSGYDCEIIRTDHNEGNVDEPLSQRVQEYLNAGVEAFVSIHHNAHTGTWNGATGVEVYTDRTPITGDKELAKLIYDRLVAYTGLKGRGIKEANWQIINQDKIPAVLCEGGFMDGTTDYKIITSDKGQENYARAVAEALIIFLGLDKNTSVPTQNSGKKTIDQVAQEVIAGKYGNGADRKAKLTAEGYDYSAVQTKVNEIMSGKTTATTENKKSNEEIAREVIAGKWGNGNTRKKKLKSAGYDYSAIQKIVNKLVK